MSLGTANRDGGKTSESGHLRGLTKAFRGEVSNGLAVSQRGAGANMSVDIAVGDAFIPRSDGTYAHPVFNDAVLNQVIATADPSNPRRDIVVLYTDYGQAPSTGVSNNTNGVVKVKVVAGTPAGSPVDPTDAAIQTSVGSGNPFIKLARVRVGAGVGSVANSVIDDLRRMATAHVQGAWLYEYLYPWVYVSATSFKIAGVDVRTVFPVGTKIQLYQGSVVKYFVVTATAFSTDTTVTIDGRGTYTLANDIIDHPAWSYELQPVGYPFGGVQSSNIDFASLFSGGVWWQELGRATAAAPVTSLSIPSFTPKKYLRILLVQHSSGVTNLTSLLRFNNDSGANYDQRTQENASADGATNGQTGINMGANNLDGAHADFFVTNEIGYVKIADGIVTYWSAGAGAIYRNVQANKWNNTAAQISRVDLICSTGAYQAGSEIIVLGHN